MTPNEPVSAAHHQEIQHLREIIAHNSDWLWEVDAQGRYTFCSEHSQLLLGYAPHEILGHTPFDFMPPTEAQRVGAQFAAIVAEQRSFSGLINRNLRSDGRLVVLETSGVPLFDSDGRLIGYRGIDRDITPAIGPLNLRLVQLEALYAAAPVALALLDREACFVNANHALAKLFQVEAAQLTGRAIETYLPRTKLDVAACLTHLDNNESIACQELDWHGRTYQTTLQGVHDPDGAVIGLTLALTDVTEQHRMRQQLADANRQLAQANARLSELAEKDYLTGLPNRRRFDESLSLEVSRALREGYAISLLMLDVDQFKAYNDLYGHQAGDACLRQLAQLFRDGLFRPGDLACRYGGEEFAIILPHAEAASAKQVAERLRRDIGVASLPHAGSPAGRVTISIGIGTLAAPASSRVTEWPGELATKLLETADRSLYMAKSAGRDQVHMACLIADRRGLI